MPIPQSTARFVHRKLTATVSLHYAEVPGDGPPMVLLHGIGMDWRVWQAVSRRLSPYVHLYMIDRRGHGDSDKPDHGYTLAHYAADIEDFFDALKIEDAILVGSSLGGAVTVAVEAPIDLIAYRVLVDPPLTGGPVRDADMFRDILHLKHEEPALLADYLAVRNPGSGRFLMEAMSSMWQRTADGVITDLLAQESTYFDLGVAMRAVESPTLVLQADARYGGVLTDRQVREAVKQLPRGVTQRVPGAGHAIHATNPVQFVHQVLSFVGLSRELSPH